MALLELLQKRGGGDFLKEVAELVLQRLMEFEVDGVVGAAGTRVAPSARLGATVTVTGRWRRGSARSTCASRDLPAQALGPG